MKKYRIKYQSLWGILLLVISIVLEVKLFENHISLSIFLAVPMAVSSLVFIFGKWYYLLTVFAVTETIFLYIYGISTLGSPYSNWLIFIGIFLIIIGELIGEYISYFDKLNFNPVFPKDKRCFLFRMLNIHKSEKLLDITESDENSIIVQSKTCKLIQIIKGENSFYFHYLNVKKNGLEIEQDSLISDYENIDTVKKYTPKDYRVNFKSIKKAEYSAQNIQNVSYSNLNLLGILLIKTQKEDKIFYAVNYVSKEKCEKFFEHIKCFKNTTDKKYRRVTVKNSIKMLGRQKIFFIILRTVTNILAAAMMSVIAPNLTIQRIITSLCIISVGLMLIFYCLYSDYFCIRDVKRGEMGNGIFSSKPNISGSFFFPVFVIAICGLVLLYNLIEYTNFLIVSGIVFAITTVILLIFTPHCDRKASAIVIVMISLGVSFGSVGTINYLFDFREPSVHTSEVYHKSSHTGYRSGTTYYLDVKLSNGKKKSLSVSYDLYKNTNEGDNVKVSEYSGLFDMPYAEIPNDN